MEGILHNYDPLTKEGRIAIGNGEFFSFDKGDYLSRDKRIVNGMGLSFDAEGNYAKNVEFLSASDLIKPKSRKVAAALAFFIGLSGAHKIYLGKNGAAIITVLIAMIAMPLSYIPSLISLVFSIIFVFLAGICIIEAISYLSKTDEEFNDTYVVGSKAWF